MRAGLVARTVAYLFLTLCALLFLPPVVWMVLQSLKSQIDVIAQPPRFVFSPTVENYRAGSGAAALLKHSCKA